ncbi:MAG: S8 family serine peptidase [Acidobacteria bacterium]|nr:S8 family serine peptidase [Acidobacteriota bacterium]
MSKPQRPTHKGLALLVLIIFAFACWQTSSWSNFAVHAAAIRASRASLDEATAMFKADPTPETASRFNEAMKDFEIAVAADPAYAKSIAPLTLAPSALLQVQILQAFKGSQTAAQKKIGSRLLIVSKKRQNKLPLGLESLRTSVETAVGGNAVVDLTVTSRIAGLKALDAYHFVIRSALGKTIRAEVPFDKLEEIAALPAIISIREPSRAYTSRMESSGMASTSGSRLAVNTGFNERAVRAKVQLQAALAKLAVPGSPRPMFVDNVSEGDRTHRALDARNGFGFTGMGVKIGVISDGVDTLATRQATGDLPAVTVLTGQGGSGDEGTAMLEIVHDLAPGAQLFFATALPTQAQFAQNIRDLRTAGCDIIVDDIIYLNESPFHDGQPTGLNSTMGIIAQAVNDVTAAGALYFSSAGNEGNKDDDTSGTWEGDFNANGTPAVLAGAGPVHNFGDGGQSVLVTFGGGNPPLLHWSDPLDTAANDYDLYDLDGSLTTIFDASTDTQDGAGGDDQPFEGISGGTFSGERLVVALFSGATRFIRLEVFRGTIALNTAGATYGHSATANAYSVAATPASAPFGTGEPSGPFPGPFTSANVSETFSCDGPRQLFYQADGTLFGAGTLAGQGLIRQKPDITAADGVMTAAPGFNPFFGTSAAAPHAAAIAALVKSANPMLTPTQIRTALTSSAIDIEGAGVDRDTGAGIVMGFEALQSIGATPIATLNLGTVTFTETGGDADGFLEPCERADFTIGLTNVGAATASAVSATLSSSTSGVVTNPAVSAYPNIAASASANNLTPFTVVLPCTLACGSTVNFTLTVTYTGGSSPQVFNFSYRLGAPGTPVTFSYTGPAVPIPDATDLSGSSPGAAVMAPLVVSGVSGPIFDVNFSIDGSSCSTTAGSTTVGLDHTFVNDLKITLISPATTSALVIDETDGSGNNFCQTVLDDESVGASIQTVVSSNAPFTGSFKPNAALSIFDGQTANGTWNLQAQDFFSGDTGNIRAYSLIITPAVCQTAPCVLTCPANVTASSAVPLAVNYAQPTLTGGCGVVTCSPASGAVFPVGTTIVTCTPQSGSSCSFTVTVVIPFDVCIQDDSNPNNVFLANSTTGAYRFCCSGTPYTGIAVVTKKGNVITFQHNAADRRLQATKDGGTFKASASLQSPPGTTKCAIIDRDTRNNTCSCP